MQRDMTFLCEMWKAAADDYINFLSRNKIECFGVHILYKNMMAIYVDEDQYLKLSIYDKKFQQDEKQLIRLLQGIEKLAEKYIELLVKRKDDQDQSGQMFSQDDE